MKKQLVVLLFIISGFIAGVSLTKKREAKARHAAEILSDKHLSLFFMMNQWVKIKQEGKNLEEYFEKNGYKNIAIYGINYVGERLLNELKNGKIKIKYGIDKKGNRRYLDINTIHPDDELENVDAIIVTPIYFIDEIKTLLSQKVSCPILSLENILYEI